MRKVFIVVILFISAVVIGASLVLYKKTPIVTATVDKHLHQISLNATGATPDLVSVKLGEEVQFNSKDGKSHNIVPGDGSGHIHDLSTPLGKESGVFGPSEAYRVAFRQAGTFKFHDALNSAISVTVIAYKESSSSSQK